MIPTIFDLRYRSLARGNLLVFASIGLTFLFSDFPHNRATPLLVIPSVLVILGTAETARCIRRRWSLIHGAVILCLYMDLMVATLVLFSLVYPYFVLLRESH